MNYAFDCILGMPWLVRYQPEADWLSRSVRRHSGYDVSEVYTHLLVSPRDWPHVTVVDTQSTTQSSLRESDGPPCEVCAHVTRSNSSGAQQLLNTEVEARAWSSRDVVGNLQPTREKCAVEPEVLPQPEHPVECAVLPDLDSESDSPSESSVASSGSRLSTSAKRRRRRAARDPRRGQRPTEESIQVMEYDGGAALGWRMMSVASPPRDASAILALPTLSWKQFLHDLKRDEIEQVCVLVADRATAHVAAVDVNMDDSQGVERPPSAEAKSAREKRFVTQSWDALKRSGNPVYALAREFADIFTDEIPAELPVDRGVRHEFDLTPGSKYCVTRLWPLPPDQVKAIDGFFEARRKAGHVRESISPHSSPTFCVKKATGGWRIVHAFNKLNDATIRVAGSGGLLASSVADLASIAILGSLVEEEGTDFGTRGHRDAGGLQEGKLLGWGCCEARK